MVQKVGESEYGQVDIQYGMIFMLGGLWEVCPFLLLVIHLDVDILSQKHVAAQQVFELSYTILMCLYRKQ